MLPDPLWYKDAIIYELHVRSFHDSDGDGIGDFKGLTAKLDYLENLGINTIWVLPFYPSPIRDDGYDIADYMTVNPIYGTLNDFKDFLEESHRRGLRVITELVINHTSDQHAWFQRARRAPTGSPERDYYVWSDTPEKYKNVPLMFPDFETSNWTWDPLAKAYYWHRFYSHQPDLNYDNTAVWQAIFPVLDFWFNLGVDGMRLDAVPYLFEREGTTCEHLPETHGFLKALRKHMDERFPNRMLLAEANAWPEDAVKYFGDGDECNMAFHFPLMPRLFMSLHQEDRFPILDMYAQTPAIPESAQWCLFLRNHDEMTLAMVTDEERDYMFRAYVHDRRAKLFLGIRHRLSPLLNNDRRRIELMNFLLFSLPGSPVLYYGDEIGMGDNIYLGDRNGVRTPMQWSADRNAGFSRANPQKLYLPIIIDPEYHYEAVNVESHQNNPSSLLWWTKRLISLRKRFLAFGRGDMAFLKSDNAKVLAFVRSYQDERILVVANLSRFMQYVELDLREFIGVSPEELFGRTTLPAITDRPYPITLGPHGCFWFSLPILANELTAGPPVSIQQIAYQKQWQDLSAGTLREDLERLLPAVLSIRPLGDGPGVVSAVRIEQAWPVRFATLDVLMLLLRVEYRAGVPERMVFPLSAVSGIEAEKLLAANSGLIVAQMDGPTPWILCDALALPDYAEGLLKGMQTPNSIPLPGGELLSTSLAPFELPKFDPAHPPVVRRNDRNKFTVSYGSDLVLKLFRRIDDESNPDLEVSQFLANSGLFPHTPAVLGYIEYNTRRARITLGILRQYVPHQGTAWQQALDQIGVIYERIAAFSQEYPPAPPKVVSLLAGPTETLRDEHAELFGGYLESVRLVGRRLGELHSALASDPAQARFSCEPFDRSYQRSLYQSLRSQTSQVFDGLQSQLLRLPPAVAALAGRVLPLRAALLSRFEAVLNLSLRSERIRCHGDLELAQLLFTGNNYFVSDFEGDPRMTSGQRRIKRSPLRDVASLLLSWRYACSSVLLGLAQEQEHTSSLTRVEDRPHIEPWVEGLLSWIGRELLSSYLERAETRNLLPNQPDAVETLLELLLLDRALQELDYDLRFRPDWAAIPLSYLLRSLTNSNEAALH